MMSVYLWLLYFTIFDLVIRLKVIGVMQSTYTLIRYYSSFTMTMEWLWTQTKHRVRQEELTIVTYNMRNYKNATYHNWPPISTLKPLKFITGCILVLLYWFLNCLLLCCKKQGSLRELRLWEFSWPVFGFVPLLMNYSFELVSILTGSLLYCHI
jgi:hypothetical protein